MWKVTKSVLAALFSSKKFLVFLTGVIVIVLAKFGLDITDGKVLEFLGLVGSYIIGQGIADHGKEAAKVAAANGGFPGAAVNDNEEKPEAA